MDLWRFPDHFPNIGHLSCLQYWGIISSNFLKFFFFFIYSGSLYTQCGAWTQPCSQELLAVPTEPTRISYKWYSWLNWAEIFVHMYKYFLRYFRRKPLSHKLWKWKVTDARYQVALQITQPAFCPAAQGAQLEFVILAFY